MAGLSAARELAEAGQRVVILEAGQRVGGRILTQHVGEEVVELGAEFIHGRAPELWALIAEAGVETYERTGDFLRNDAGDPEPQHEQQPQPPANQDDPLDRLKSFTGPDCSFIDYLQRFGLSADQRAEQIAYVEGFNAADASEASAMALGRQQAAEDAIEGDRSWRVSAGYAQLPEFLRRAFLAAAGTLIFGAQAEEVTWSSGQVSIRTTSGALHQARKVIVALPLGVLQSDAIRICPMPASVADAIARLRMGDALRCTLIFGRRLWPERMSFLLTPELLPGVWWTAHPAKSLSLTGWVGGPRAASLIGLPDAELQPRILAALAGALRLDPAELQASLSSFHTYDWRAGKASRGAYSWVPVGGLDASEALSRPVEDTLYFAGEHTDTTSQWGTVHAALRSGLRAAKQVLAG